VRLAGCDNVRMRRGVSGWVHASDRRWPAALVLLVMVVLQGLTPGRLTFEPRWLLPTLELLGLAILVALHPYENRRAVRAVFTAVLGVASLAMLWSVHRLAWLLVIGADPETPKVVLLTGAVIWVNAIGVFGLWYWELDGGGPAARAEGRRPPDFLFPQRVAQEVGWRPGLVDYLYVAYTNASTYGPTHALPLSRGATLTLTLQSGMSLLIVVVVVARAVGVK
jgi:hypothetical protein